MYHVYTVPHFHGSPVVYLHRVMYSWNHRFVESLQKKKKDKKHHVSMYIVLRPKGRMSIGFKKGRTSKNRLCSNWAQWYQSLRAFYPGKTQIWTLKRSIFAWHESVVEVLKFWFAGPLTLTCTLFSKRSAHWFRPVLPVTLHGSLTPTRHFGIAGP